MAAAYLEYEFFSDNRWAFAARLLSIHHFMVRQAVVNCWVACYNNRTPRLTPQEIQINAEWEGDVDDLTRAWVKARICDDNGDGTYTFRGTEARIQVLKGKSSSGRAGGLAAAKAKLQARQEFETSQAGAKRTPASAEQKTAGAKRPLSDRHPEQVLSECLADGEQDLAPAKHLLSTCQADAEHSLTDCLAGAEQTSTDSLAGVLSVGRSVVPVFLSNNNTPYSPPPPVDNSELAYEPTEDNSPPDSESPSRPRRNRELERQLRDEAIRITQACLSIALNPPSRMNPAEARAEIVRRVPEVGRRVVERKVGPDGWPTFVSVITAASGRGTLGTQEAQLREAIAAELRKDAAEGKS